MRTVSIRVRGLKTALFVAGFVALCAWWSIPWIRQHVDPAFSSLSFTESTDSRGLFGEAALQPSGEKQSWLKRIFLPPKLVDPKQRALTQLEASGMPFTGDGFVRAVQTGHRPLVDLFLTAGMDVNTTSSDGRTALLVATLAKDWDFAQRFLDLGGNVNLQDENGLTPLMAAAMVDHVPTVQSLLAKGASVDAVDAHQHSALHYAVATRSIGSLEALLQTGADCTSACCEGRNLLSHASETGEWRIVEPILTRQPPQLEWNSFTRAELMKGITSRDSSKTKLLLSKHPAPPTPDGSPQPLLAHAIVSDNFAAFKFLLECGASPDTPLNSPVQKAFSQRVNRGFLKHYLDTESGMTTLMLAAGLGRADYVKTLLDHGAKRGTGTKKYRMPALLFATRGDSIEVAQMLIGNCPKPEELRIQISLGSQRASIIRNGVTAYSTSVSTGRSGFRTPTGNFIVTDKHRSHVSTIYKVPMPFFMRLSARDFGMHKGVVPGYPASHGCIRVPAGMAQKLFREIPVGTMVSITH